VAWETRGGKAEYFYLSQRLPDGRILKKYIGTGLLAEVESLWLERKAAVRRQLSEERQQIAAAETLLKQHLRSTTDATHALMLSIGYTNERSRGWRRLPMIAPNEASHDVATPDTDEQGDSFSELVNAARQGDRSVIPALRRMMRENPTLAKNNGDLASQTQIHWIDLIAGQDFYYRECLLMKIAKSKRELLAETKGTVVGEMLVDQAISTWLQLYYHEDREATSPAENMQIGEYRLKKIESAFNRHMRSLSALTALKAVQFSQKMVNAMAATTSDDGSNSAAALSATSRIKTNGNRLTNAFGGAFEPISMN
jgi:hypothetical protein